MLVVSAHMPGWDVQGLRSLAAAVATEPRYVAVLAGGEPPAIVIARGAGAALDAGAVVRALTGRFGGKGGGRPELAQAGGLTGAPEEILAAAVESLPAERRD